MNVIRRKENDSLSMICNYSGHPKGTIKWMISMFKKFILGFINFVSIIFQIDNNTLSSSSSLSSENGIRFDQSEQPNDMIIIDRLKRQNSGIFKCQVDNIWTSDQKSFQLIVDGKCCCFF